MGLNKITKTALEALIETCQKIVERDAATFDLVKNCLGCICYIIDDPEVHRGAGIEAPMGLIGGRWAIGR